MYNTLKSVKVRALILIDRFRHEVAGVAALEFAIIAPIMILLFFGTIEISTAVAVNRKISRVSSTLGDLITQSQTLTESDLTDIMEISGDVMKPYDHTLNITITGIWISNGIAKVVWSREKEGANAVKVGTTHPANSVYTVPSQIKTDNTFLVSAKVETTHTPIVGFVSYGANNTIARDTDGIDMEEEIFLRPRIGTQTSIIANPPSP